MTVLSALLGSCVVMSDLTFASPNDTHNGWWGTNRSTCATQAFALLSILEPCFWDKSTEMVCQYCNIRNVWDMKKQKRFAEEKESLMDWRGNIFSSEQNTMREPSFQWVDRWGGWFICMVHHLAICPLTTNRIVFHISCRPPSSSGNLIIFVEFLLMVHLF